MREHQDVSPLGQTLLLRVPPVNSARANCQPSIMNMMIPNSITRFVEANSKAMADVKYAPLRKMERARATAA